MKITLSNKEILALRLSGHSYQYIADQSGVSRQRIQQILSPPIYIRNYVVDKFKGLCDDCGIYLGSAGHVHYDGANGEEDYNDRENLRLLCISCHRKAHAKSPQFQCINCGIEMRKNSLFCSRECLMQYHTTTLTCSYCGKTFSLGTSVAYWRVKKNKSGQIYCSKKCQGSWLAENYGFGAFPEHAGKRKTWDYEKIYRAQDETGFGSPRLSRLLKIPEGTIAQILHKRKLQKVSSERTK